MDNTLLTAFIAVTAAAVVLQMLILFGMFLVMRKLAGRVEALADKVEDTTGLVQTRVLPIVENAKVMQEQVKQFIETSRPKIEKLVQNASEVSDTTKATVERLNLTVNDAVDRMRLQVIRGDEMITRTMDRIEDTSEKVQHTVMSPVRQMSGIMQAISTGFGAYFNQQRRRRNGGPADEMFI
jgi:methyl-accepting chemotaxis protein